MQQAKQCRHWNYDHSDSVGFGGCWVASCDEVHLAVRLQEETLQNETSHNWYKNRTLDPHSSEDEDISAQWQWHYWHKPTQSTGTTNCRSTVPVVHKLQGGPIGLRQKEAPHIDKDSSQLRIFMLFFF